MTLLIVDDDPRLRDLLRLALERAGYQVHTAANGQEAVTRVARDRPDLVVLDIGLPELDGYEVCRRIRTTSEVPILFLTARDDEIDRVLGFELGADDYVTKPFSPREVVARVKAILKRSGATQPDATLSFADLTLDPKSKVCQIRGHDVSLTATEFQILALLLQNQASMTQRSALVTQIWGQRSQVSDRTLDSHVRNLRAKLTDAGSDVLLETVHGQGFRLRVPRA